MGINKYRITKGWNFRDALMKYDRSLSRMIPSANICVYSSQLVRGAWDLFWYLFAKIYNIQALAWGKDVLRNCKCYVGNSFRLRFHLRNFFTNLEEFVNFPFMFRLPILSFIPTFKEDIFLYTFIVILFFIIMWSQAFFYIIYLLREAHKKF